MQNFLDKFNAPPATTTSALHQISSVEGLDRMATEDERDLANDMEKSMSVDEPADTIGPSAMRKSSSISNRMFSLLERLPSISTQSVLTVPPILTGIAPRTPQSKSGSPNSVNSGRSGSKRGAASAETINNENGGGDSSGGNSNNSSSSAKKLKTSGSKGLIQMTMDQMLPPINSARSTHPTDDDVLNNPIVLLSASNNDWTWQCTACTYVNKSAGYASTMRGNRRAQPKKEETCAMCNIPRASPSSAAGSAGGSTTEVINLID